MNIFSQLTKKRSELAAVIEAERLQVKNAERALTLCDQLEKDIPTLIKVINAEGTAPYFSQYAADEDFTNRHELTRSAWAIVAAERLRADIPEIRKHWKGVLKELAS